MSPSVTANRTHTRDQLSPDALNLRNTGLAFAAVSVILNGYFGYEDRILGIAGLILIGGACVRDYFDKNG